MPIKDEVLNTLRNVAISEFPEATEPDKDITIIYRGHDKGRFHPEAIRVAWKTHDDKKRETKEINPIIIKLLNIFIQDTIDNTSPDALTEMSVHFKTFISEKRRNFTPSAPDHPTKLPIPEFWAFPH